MRNKWLSCVLVAGAAVATACSPPPSPDAGPDSGGGTDVAPMDFGAPDVFIPDVPPVDNGPLPDAGTLTARPANSPTNGSALAAAPDFSRAVGTNRTANSISVFNTMLGAAPPTATRSALLPTGPGSEPWAAVVSNDGLTAYAILRGSRQAIKITGLNGTPAIDSARANTGSEPTGIAISPTGQSIYVANWAEGTVSVIATGNMTVTRTVDLNATLASSGMLGTVTARPGLAHPRAIVVTNSGDTNDDDETVYVTEFFSQAVAAGVTDDSQFDVNRQGVVYRFNAGTGAVGGTTTIAPVANTGFQASNNMNTGCFPNQLYAAALNNGRLYVTAVCESPRGPIGPVTTATPPDTRNFKTEIHTAVFVINTTTNMEVAAQGLLLTKRFQDRYDMSTPPAPDDGVARRIPLIANDISFVPTAPVAYITSYGSDAVFRIQYMMDGSLVQVGSAMNGFINLAPAGAGAPAAGRLPIGLIVQSSSAALALNENTRNLSVLDLTQQAVSSVVVSADAPAAGPETEANDGRRFFATGLGRWSFKGQGWNSCETCHPDGLTDNVTWFFGRGPRQTTSLDGTFSPDGTLQRILNWTAIFDEVDDFELNTRGNSGGVGALVHALPAAGTAPAAGERIIFDGATPVLPQRATRDRHDGLNGSTRAIQTAPGVLEALPATTNVVSALRDWEFITRYVKTIRAPKAPVGFSAGDPVVMAGRTLFTRHNCAACHGGPNWTISRVFWTPSVANNNTLRTTMYNRPAGYPMGLNPPTNAGAATVRFTDINPMVVGANDQINCILRNVGTFPATGTVGVTVAGGPVIKETRPDMMTTAQGASGFNPPSLVGMVTGAPYGHAGNARTLEELFDNTFRAHHQAHSANFLDPADTNRAQELREIVAFVMSIDESTTPVAPAIMELCPPTL